MTDTLKKITTMIEELKRKSETDKREVSVELEKAHVDLNNATSVLEVTDDKNEYMNALSTIEINKRLITVLSRRMENVKHPLTKEGLSDAKRDVLNYHKEINGEYAAKINKELTVILDTLREYNTEIDRLNKTCVDLDKLAGVSPTGLYGIKAGDLYKEVDDRGRWFPEFIKWYYNKLALNNRLKI